MTPELSFRDTVYLYEPTKGSYGQDIETDAHETAGLLVQATSFGHASFQDSISSGSILALPKEDTFVSSRGARLEGVLARVNPFGASDDDQWFRITNVTPARDVLLDNQVRHYECNLEKVGAPSWA